LCCFLSLKTLCHFLASDITCSINLGNNIRRKGIWIWEAYLK
jgi:hypothetical protein